MQIDLSNVHAEVTAAFDACEAALVSNDVETLNALLPNDHRTLHCGAAENRYGHAGIGAFRATRLPAGLARTLSRTVFTTYGQDCAVAPLCSDDSRSPASWGGKRRRGSASSPVDGSWRRTSA